MIELCLYNLEQAAILVPQAGAPLLFNATEGMSFTRRDIEGFCVPISNDPLPEASREEYLDALLASVVSNHTGALTPKQADQLDDALLTLSSSDLVSVARSKLNDSSVGWVWVSVVPSEEFSQFQGLEPFEGVLTWPNKLN